MFLPAEGDREEALGPTRAVSPSTCRPLYPPPPAFSVQRAFYCPYSELITFDRRVDSETGFGQRLILSFPRRCAAGPAQPAWSFCSHVGNLVCRDVHPLTHGVFGGCKPHATVDKALLPLGTPQWTGKEVTKFSNILYCQINSP